MQSTPAIDPHFSHPAPVAQVRNSQNIRPLRIAFVIDSIVGWTAGGTERQLAKLIAALDRTLFEPHLFVLQDSPELKAGELPFPVSALATKARWFDVNLLLKLKERLQAFQPDMVQTFFLDGTILGALAARMASVPVIIQSRRSVGYLEASFAKQLALRAAHRVTTSWQCNSRFVGDFIHKAEGVPNGRIEVVPNMLDTEYFSPAKPQERESLRRKLGFSQSTTAYLAVSNLRSVKDLSTFVSAAAEVLPEVPGAQFHIIGEGPLREGLTKQIKELNLQGIVRLVGEQSDVRNWLIASDIGVLTSRSEGSSNALLEYMAMGLPSVVSDIPANRELIPGLFFRPGDPSQLAKQLVRLWKNADERKQLRDAYQTRVQAHSPSAIAKRLQDYYFGLAKTQMWGTAQNVAPQTLSSKSLPSRNAS